METLADRICGVLASLIMADIHILAGPSRSSQFIPSPVSLTLNANGNCFTITTGLTEDFYGIQHTSRKFHAGTEDVQPYLDGPHKLYSGRLPLLLRDGCDETASISIPFCVRIEEKSSFVITGTDLAKVREKAGKVSGISQRW